MSIESRNNARGSKRFMLRTDIFIFYINILSLDEHQSRGRGVSSMDQNYAGLYPDLANLVSVADPNEKAGKTLEKRLYTFIKKHWCK